MKTGKGIPWELCRARKLEGEELSKGKNKKETNLRKRQTEDEGSKDRQGKKVKYQKEGEDSLLEVEGESQLEIDQVDGTDVQGDKDSKLSHDDDKEVAESVGKKRKLAEDAQVYIGSGKRKLSQNQESIYSYKMLPGCVGGRGD